MANENSVMKALTPEEKTLLANVKAGIEEILSISDAGGAMAENGMQTMEPAAAPQEKQVAMADDAQETTPQLEEAPDEKKASVKKDTTSQPGDTADAEDPTEKKTEDVIPEGSTEALAEIAKALMALTGKSVKKSEVAVNPLVSTIASQSQAMKNLNQKVDFLANKFSELLDGMGVTKQLEIAAEAAKQEAKPVMSTDSDLVMKHLANLIKGNVAPEDKQIGTPQMQNQEIVRKNSRSMAEWLLSGDARDERNS